jgi:hypothetical protein
MWTARAFSKILKDLFAFVVSWSARSSAAVIVFSEQVCCLMAITCLHVE